MIVGLVSSWSCGITIFQSWIPMQLLSNPKAENTCEDLRKADKVCQF